VERNNQVGEWAPVIAAAAEVVEHQVGELAR